MTTIPVSTPLTRVPSREETGVWVRLHSFPACSVFVRDSEVRAAYKRNDPTRAEWKVLSAIAIGKRAGSYPAKSGDIRGSI